jgi:hypothetical protein
MNAERRTQNEERRSFSILRSAFCVLRSVALRHRFALVLIFLIALTIFISPLARQEVFTLRDHLDYFQPLRWFTADELRAGHLPLWNPYNASGEAWLANPQTGVFYPPAWLFLALPFPTAYMLFLLLHLLLLGWGAYFFFARDASPEAAMLGAIAFMLSGPVLSLLDVNNNLASLAWIPLVLWCAAERAPVRGGLALALTFLAGEPFLAAVAALLYVCVSRKVRDVAMAAVIALGACAIQLLPFLELIAGSDRVGGMAKELILRDSMPLRDWPRVAISPAVLSGTLDPKLGQHFIPVIYMGAFVVLFALLGLTRWKRAIGWIALLILVVIVASGPPLLAHLPLTLFRYPARVVPLASLALAALAVSGWDRVRRGKRWVDLLFVLAISLELLSATRPLFQSAPFRRDIVPYDRAIGARSKFLRTENIDPAHRVAWISGYLNLYDRRFDADTAAPLANERYLELHRRVLTRPSPIVVDALPAGDLLASFPMPPPYEAIAREANVTVYRNRNARSMAVVMTRDAITPARWEIGTSHARVIADAPADGIAVLAQQDAPQWRVRVDGKKAEKRRIFGLFLGVDVPGGHHVVDFDYHARSLFAGAAMTLVTLIALPLFLFVKQQK